MSRDWETYSSELGGVTAISESIFPIELSRAMFIGMDPPKHDRVKQLFQKGFTPRRIAEHEDEIRAIVVRVLDRLEGREEAELVSEVAQPVVARVIGSFMGIPEEDDITWARLMNNLIGAGEEELEPSEIPAAIERDVGELFQRCQSLINERRERPTDDLTSVLVHAEVDGQRLEEHEIVMGFFLLMAAGNDSTKATYCSAMRALMENPDQRQILLDDPSLVPSAVEEALRMFPAFAHFRRTATKDTELGGLPDPQGRQGRHVVRLVQPRRGDVRRPGPLRRQARAERAPGVRRRRPALLPRHRARTARAQHPARGDPQALPADGDGRDARARRGAVRQPVAVAPGPTPLAAGRLWLAQVPPGRAAPCAS